MLIDSNFFINHQNYKSEKKVYEFTKKCLLVTKRLLYLQNFLRKNFKFIV